MKQTIRVILSAALVTLVSGCQVEDSADAPDAEVWPISWALALDPGVPFDTDLLEEAAQDGFSRWEVDPSPMRFFYQGVGDVPSMNNDGLQVIYIWWYSSDVWPEDSSAVVQQRTYQTTSGDTLGFDLTVNGPGCLGEAEGGDNMAKTALANTIAKAIGVAFDALNPDGSGSHLSEAACETAGPLFPTEEEIQSLLGDD